MIRAGRGATPAASFAVARQRRPRGAFGLDERRRPDPARVATEIGAFLRERLPEVWVVEAPADDAATGRTLLLLLAHGHAAVLQVERDARAPSEAARALAAHCRDRAVPAAVVASLAEARAALRRFGVEPRPAPAPTVLPWRSGRCPAKPNR